MNASNTSLNPANPGFYVNPVRFIGSNTSSNLGNALSYNSNTFEIFNTDTLMISSLFVNFGVLSNGTFLSSDSNIKENICSADLDICYSNIKQLPLRRFNYIPSYATSRFDQTQLGFIAQEAYSLYPKSICSSFDEELSSDVLHLNFDQIFLSHYGATQKLISTVEQQNSTIEGQGSQLITLTTAYSTLITQFSTFLGQQSPVT
jgi:hypothetical protein